MLGGNDRHSIWPAGPVAVVTERDIARLIMIEDQVSYGDAFGVALSLTQDLLIVARASDAETGIELCESMDPDLVVTDYRLTAGETGTQIAAHLRDNGFTKPIVLLSGFAAPQVRREAAAIENVFLLSKDDSIADLVTDLRAILDGEPPSLSIPANAETSTELSPGEQEVLEYLNTGMSPTEIANDLHLSIHTIRARIKAMHRKLGVKSQSGAIVVATRRGLLVPPA